MSIRNRSGFTLIEMLTVIAITAVLLTIITVPIFQSFNLTRAAEAFADAQSQGRTLTERIAHELQQAVSVRGSSVLVASNANGSPVKLPAHSLIVQVPGKNGATVDVVLPWTKLDMILPVEGTIDPSLPTGSYRNPITGKIDPTLIAPKGQVQLPVVAGTILKRYFVGLLDPASKYNDPYTGLLMVRGGQRDNLVVLYAASSRPIIMTQNGPLVNSALFDTDPATGQPVYDDPRFFVLDRDGAGNIVQDDHSLRVYHWRGMKAPWENGNDPIKNNPVYFAHTIVQTEVSRYDMIQVQRNGPIGNALYDGNIPRLTPLVQFRPTVVSSDPAAGQEAVRQGQETDNAAAISPDTFQTQYGLWNNAVVRDFPPGYLQSDPTRNKYLIGYNSLTGAPGFSIYAYDPSAGAEFDTGFEVFDTYTYDNTVALGLSYPFTQAALAANARSGWLAVPAVRALFTPYHLLSGTGKIISSFGIDEVGLNPLPVVTGADPDDMSPTRPNLPTLFIPDVPQSVINDNGAGAVYGGPGYDINRAFNRAWNENTNLQPDLQRFIDLRVTPNEDGTFSPLYPGYINGTVTGFPVANADGSLLTRAKIVPGSEVVYGPDQNPGPNFGRKIRYTRTTHAPGPNQYRINYVDQIEPSRPGGGSGTIVDGQSYELMLGLTNPQVGSFSPTTYDATNLVSAVIEPRYKAGYIQLNSDPNIPLPQGYLDGGGNLIQVPFKVFYRFQLNGTVSKSGLPLGAGSADVFAVDYDSRQLMQVLLTIRNYPQSNLPNPQSITLKATAAIRNLVR